MVSNLNDRFFKIREVNKVVDITYSAILPRPCDSEILIRKLKMPMLKLRRHVRLENIHFSTILDHLLTGKVIANDTCLLPGSWVTTKLRGNQSFDKFLLISGEENQINMYFVFQNIVFCFFSVFRLRVT